MEKFNNNFDFYLIHKKIYLIILIYILLILGIFFKYYLKLGSNDLLLFLVLIINSYFMFYKIICEDLNKKLEDSSNKCIFNYKNLSKNLKIFFLSLISFLLGCFIPIDSVNLWDIVCSILLGFALSLFTMYNVFFLNKKDKKFNLGILITFLFIIISLLLKFYFSDFISVTNLIMGYKNDYLILSLTFILLSATLSLLAFTYKMILESDNNIMKNNGENFFISTIFSGIFFIFAFLLSAFCKFLKITSKTQMNLLYWADFLEVFFFTFLLINCLFFAYFMLKFLIQGFRSSLEFLLQR